MSLSSETMWLLIPFLTASHCFAAEKKEGIGRKGKERSTIFQAEVRRKNFKAWITFSKSITVKSSLSKKIICLGTQELSIL